MYMVQNRKNEFGIVKTVMFLCIPKIRNYHPIHD